MRTPQRSPEPEEAALFSLLRYFDSQVKETGSFEITLDDLCGRLSIHLVDAYRTLYSAAPEISGYIPERFDAGNVGMLAEFLNRLNEYDVYQVFRSAGVHLASEDISELSAIYFDQVNAAIAAHIPQTSEFRMMYTRFRNLRRAFKVYLDYFFEAKTYYDDSIANFIGLRRYTFPALGRLTVRRYLDLLFDRHVISFESVCEPLYDRLVNNGRKKVEVNSAALKALGLSSLPSDKQDLRLQYKSLMKTYHPDVNPAGLEMSRKINTAYAELLAFWSR